jgi:outer membrane protein assembly factor BamE (lipoprotein component of BamABCDE complex)
MMKMMLFGLMMITAAGLSACSFSRGNIGDEFNSGQLEAVKKGISTRADVVSTLGAPDRIVEANGHEIFQYYRYDIKASSLWLILLNLSRLNIKSDDLYVFLNRQGIVEEIVFGKRTDRLQFQFWPFGK